MSAILDHSVTPFIRYHGGGLPLSGEKLRGRIVAVYKWHHLVLVINCCHITPTAFPHWWSTIELRQRLTTGHVYIWRHLRKHVETTDNYDTYRFYRPLFT